MKLFENIRLKLSIKWVWLKSKLLNLKFRILTNNIYCSIKENILNCISIALIILGLKLIVPLNIFVYSIKNDIDWFNNNRVVVIGYTFLIAGLFLLLFNVIRPLLKAVSKYVRLTWIFGIILILMSYFNFMYIRYDSLESKDIILGYLYALVISTALLVILRIMSYFINSLKDMAKLNFLNNYQIKSNEMDEPLESPIDDYFGRALLAENIFKYIQKLSINQSTRIGILGEWGSGKSTTMNFVKWYCKENGYPIVSFNPWQFSNKSEAWKGFVSSIERGINEWKGTFYPTFTKNKILKILIKLTSEGGKLGESINRLFLSRFEASVEISKETIQKQLTKILKGDRNKKLVLFIDDLDRADSTIVYEFLMLLKEILSIGGFVFVVGLNHKEINIILKALNRSDNSKEYLDKIIDCSFDLSLYTSIDFNKILDKILISLNSRLDKEVLKDIAPLIYDNPRKFKKFIRTLDFKFNNFTAEKVNDKIYIEELNLKAIYAMQYLEVFYENAYKTILKDEDILKDLQENIFWQSFHYDEPEKYEEKLDNVLSKIYQKDECDESKRKIKDIYIYLRNVIGNSSMKEESASIGNLRYQIDIFNGLSHQLISWKEFNDILGLSFEQAHEDVFRYFVEVFNTEELSLSKKREFLKLLMHRRNMYISEAVDSYYESEIIGKNNRAEQFTDVCIAIVKNEEIFKGEDPIFNTEMAQLWITKIREFIAFTHPDYYHRIRQKEKELIQIVCSRYENKDAVTMYEIIQRLIHDSISEREKVLAAEAKYAIENLRNRVIDYLISLFSSKNGIKNLWGKDNCLTEKEFLFLDNKYFHDKNVYDKVKEVISIEELNKEIRLNCLEYFRILNYMIIQQNQEKTLDIYKNHYNDFLVFIWKCVISEPLNRRQIGSFNDDRTKILEKLPVRELEIMDKPEWWDNIYNIL